MEVWPKDWSLSWMRSAVGNPLRLTVSIFVVVVLVVLELIWPHIFIRTSVVLGSMLVYSFFAMRGVYKRYAPLSED